MELFQCSLCGDSTDYTNVLSNLSIAKNLLDCDSSGKVPTDSPSSQVLLNMFRDDVKTPTNNGFWKSSFADRNICYYDQSSAIQETTWTPTLDNCEKIGINGACNPTDTFVSNDTNNVFTVSTTQQGVIYETSEFAFAPLPETTQIIMAFTVDATDIVVSPEPTYLTFYAQCGNRSTVVWFEDSNVVASNEPSAAIAADYSVAIDTWDGVAYKTEIEILDEIMAYLDLTAAGGAIFGNIVGGGAATQTIDTVEPSVELVAFSDISNNLACYLGNLDGNQSYDKTLQVIIGLCALIKKRVTIDRMLNKSLLTINSCDL
jgi:hypothetical protein